MKRALHISADLSLPLDAITQTFGILAVRGAGKSNTAAAMAEEMYTAKLPFVVIDPVGSWWGLRAAGDGKGRGLELPIFGGAHGDVPLERGAGGLLADLVVDQRMTCVLDVSEFSEGDKIRFLIDFAERLYRRNKEPLHLFLEEADDYAPQRPMREQARLLGAWQNIVRRGRARGLGITMITQRSAVLNKDVLTQIETLIVMRTTSPQDNAAIAAWVKYQGGSADMLATLPKLEAGEAWVWSPSWLSVFKRVRIRRRFTFDSGATPATGSRAAATLADIDLGAIKERMAETIERAKADDPKALRARLAELEKQLKQQPKASPPKVVERPVFKDGQLAKLDEAIARAQKALDTARELAEQTHGLAMTASIIIGQAKTAIAPATTRSPAPAPMRQNRERLTKPQAIDTSATKPVSRSNGHAGAELGNSGMRRMLIVLCESPAPITTSQLAIRTGIARKGGTFRTYVGKLITESLAVRVGDRLTATDAGRAAVGDYDPLPTGSELLEHWIRELGSSGAARMLRAIADAHPKALSREQLGQATDIAVEGGTFRTYLGKLKTLELVEGRGEFTLSEDLVG